MGEGNVGVSAGTSKAVKPGVGWNAGLARRWHGGSFIKRLKLNSYCAVGVRLDPLRVYRVRWIANPSAFVTNVINVQDGIAAPPYGIIEIETPLRVGGILSHSGVCPESSPTHTQRHPDILEWIAGLGVHDHSAYGSLATAS